MKSQRLLLSCVICILCLSGAISSARGQDQAFNARMSLEETMAWLGKRLPQQATHASLDNKTYWQRGTSLVKAKGCALSYWSTLQTEGLDPVSGGYGSRELWTLDLSGLDPASINGLPSGQVWFSAAATSRNAIRTNIFNRDERLQTVLGNRPMGHFFVRDAAEAREIAAGLRHAVELCRQQKR